MRQNFRLARFLQIALFSLIFAAPTGSGAQQPQAAASGDSWYAQAYAQGERGFLVTHLWSKGSKMRAEIVIAGHRISTIVNGEHYYVIDEVGGTGAAIRRAPVAVAEDAGRGRPFGREVEALIASGAEKVGEENFGGMSCNLYRITDAGGRRTGCAGIDPPHLPIKVETYSRSTGKTDVLSYVNWLGGLRLPDSFFEPDARIVLERVEYEEYTKRSRRGPVGPAPVMYQHLLHGERK